MAEIYHLKIKKEYAAALIDDLIKIDAVEDINITEPTPLQKEALNAALLELNNNPEKFVAWNSVKNRFIN